MVSWFLSGSLKVASKIARAISTESAAKLLHFDSLKFEITSLVTNFIPQIHFNSLLARPDYFVPASKFAEIRRRSPAKLLPSVRSMELSTAASNFAVSRYVGIPPPSTGGEGEALRGAI